MLLLGLLTQGTFLSGFEDIGSTFLDKSLRKKNGLLPFWHMAVHLKCVFCMLKHVVVVPYTNAFIGFLIPRKYGCRQQDIYPTLTSSRDIVNRAVFGTGQEVIW